MEKWPKIYYNIFVILILQYSYFFDFFIFYHFFSIITIVIIYSYIFPPSNFELTVITAAPHHIIINVIVNTIADWFSGAEKLKRLFDIFITYKWFINKLFAYGRFNLKTYK